MLTDQERFDNYFELFSTPGWKQLTEELNEDATRRESQVLLQSSSDEFHFQRGYVAALTAMYHLENIVQATYDENNNADL